MAKTTRRCGTLAERFWPKVDKGGPVPAERPDLGACWIWTAALDRRSYGWIRDERGAAGRNLPAHRVAYELVVGPVAADLDVDHLCRNPACVNPAHLEPVTHRENMLRGQTFAAENLRKTHCPHGHPYDEANTRWKKNGTKRDCRACDRERHRQRYAAHLSKP